MFRDFWKGRELKGTKFISKVLQLGFMHVCNWLLQNESYGANVVKEKLTLEDALLWLMIAHISKFSEYT